MPPEELNLKQQADLTAQDDLRVQPMTQLQWAGVTLAIVCFVCILVVTILVAFDWVVGGPSPPTTLPGDPEQAQMRIENWQALREADLERPKELFNLVVLSALLPLLTLLVGYLFGQQAGSR